MLKPVIRLEDETVDADADADVGVGVGASDQRPSSPGSEQRMFLRKRRAASAEHARVSGPAFPRFVPGDAVVVVGGGWRLNQYRHGVGLVTDTLSGNAESVVLFGDGRRRRLANRWLVRHHSMRP